MHAIAPISTRASCSFGLSHARVVRPLVFLAEDDAELRCLLREALRSAGYDVLSASNGHDMLKLLTAASRGEVAVPDAIVMDMRMPRCGGIEVLTALRLAEWQQPVVMITAFGERSLHDEARRHGATVVLDKPLDANDLTEIIDVLRLRHHDEICARSCRGGDPSAPKT